MQLLQADKVYRHPFANNVLTRQSFVNVTSQNTNICVYIYICILYYIIYIYVHKMISVLGRLVLYRMANSQYL